MFLLLSVGTFSALVELLNMEIEYVFMEFFFFLNCVVFVFLNSICCYDQLSPQQQNTTRRMISL